MKYAITTIDNPFDPRDDFYSWLKWDWTKGYDTCGALARLYEEDESLSEEENDALKEKAIDDLIAADPFGIYRKITYPSSNTSSDTSDPSKV